MVLSMKRFKFLFLAIFLCPTFLFAQNVVIDPGHSVKTKGATSCTGKLEYLYNNQLAHTVQNYLTQRGVHTLLSRKDTEEISLENRAQLSEGKDLFVSLHHDSAQPQFITYVDGKPFTKDKKGYSVFVSRKNPYFEESLQAALVIAKELYQDGLSPSFHHGEKITGESREAVDQTIGVYYYDDLIVLKRAKSPAVLVEAAVIIHEEDETLCQTTPYQVKIAHAIYKATQLFKK